MNMRYHAHHYVILHGKGDFADRIKLLLLNWLAVNQKGDYSGEPSLIT